MEQSEYLIHPLAWNNTYAWIGFYSLSKPVNADIYLTSWTGFSELYISQAFATISGMNNNI